MPPEADGNEFVIRVNIYNEPENISVKNAEKLIADVSDLDTIVPRAITKRVITIYSSEESN